MKKKRAERITSELRCMCFHLGTAIYSHYLISGTDFFPPLMGGTGAIANVFKDAPYYEPVPGLQTFCLFHIGFYLGDFLDGIAWATQESNYWEMLLHHVLTITLVVGMTFQN